MTRKSAWQPKSLLITAAVGLIAVFGGLSCGGKPNSSAGKAVWNGNPPPPNTKQEATLAVEDQRDVLLNDVVRVQRILPQLKNPPPTKSVDQTDGCIKHHYSGFPKTYLRSDFTGCNWTANPDDAQKSRKSVLKGRLEFTDDTVAVAIGATIADPPTHTANGDLQVLVSIPKTKQMVTQTTWHQNVKLTLGSNEIYPVSSTTSYGGIGKTGMGSWTATQSARWQIPSAESFDGAGYTLAEGSTFSLSYFSPLSTKKTDRIQLNMIARSPVQLIKDQHGCMRATGTFDWEQKDLQENITTGSFTVGANGIVDPTTHAAKPWKNDCMR